MRDEHCPLDSVVWLQCFVNPVAQLYLCLLPAPVGPNCVQLLCGEVEQESEEGFEEAVRKFRSLVSLDPWYNAIIAKIRRELPSELNSLR